MKNQQHSEAQFTVQVRNLLNRIHTEGRGDSSIFVQANSYFTIEQTHQVHFHDLLVKRKEYQQKANTGSKKAQAEYRQQLKVIEHEIEAHKSERSEQNHHRYSYIAEIAREIIALADGEDFEDSARKSAKLLGTIQLIMPIETKRLAQANEQSKPLYKAVLCLRLFDRLYLDGNIQSQYVLNIMKAIPREIFSFVKEIDPVDYYEYVEYVKLPIVMAALLQDIGNYHPDAQKVLYGENGDQNPFRTLEIDERKLLLQTNYRETLRYVMEGVGGDKYTGNYKLERDQFNAKEKRKVAFIRLLLKSWVNPESGIGNLLKVPQIYTSMVLSTKPNFNYKLIPRVYQVLQQNAANGHCSKLVVDSLHKITGTFPQGFGVTYLPKDSTGTILDRYEYAIVTQLYPEHVDEPVCRSATRNLAFISRGIDVAVTQDINLYYPESAKRLAKMSKKRLQEILEKLVSNYQERKDLDVIPRCWIPQEYFSLGKNQNLWNKAG